MENLVRLQNQPQNPLLIQSQMSYNRTILAAMPFRTPQEDTRSRIFRPISPVKMISNLLNAGQAGQSNTPSKHRHDVPPLRNVPAMLPSTPAKAIADLADSHTNKVTLVETATESHKSPLALLEDTFTAYVVALRSRSGNVVGKVLRGRATAEELLVNELYNVLRQSIYHLLPKTRFANHAQLRILIGFRQLQRSLLTYSSQPSRSSYGEHGESAWVLCLLQTSCRVFKRPLVSSSHTNMLLQLIVWLDSGRSALFSQQVKQSVEDMSPQNSRAFAAAIKLLSELVAS